jgi:hypothetical protein
LVRRNEGSGFAVQPAHDVVGLRAKLYTRDIFYADDAAAGRFADDDFSELFRRCHAALRPHGIREGLSLRDRLAAHLARRVDAVLRLNGGDNFGNGDGQFCEPVGLHPQAHGVLAGAKNLDAPDAVGTIDLVGEIDVRVIGQKARIVSALR